MQLDTERGLRRLGLRQHRPQSCLSTTGAAHEIGLVGALQRGTLAVSDRGRKGETGRTVSGRTNSGQQEGIYTLTVEFGPELRRWRESRNLSLRALAARVNYSKSQLADYEHSVRQPSLQAAERLDAVLAADGALRRLATGPSPQVRRRALRVTRSVPFDVCGYTDMAVGLLSARERSDDMHRRMMLFALGGFAGLGAASPGLAAEAVRHGLTLSGDPGTEIVVEEWQAIVTDYGVDYFVTPPDQLVESLLVDMLNLQRALQQAPGQTQAGRDLQRCAALLAAFMAMTVSNLGHLRDSRRWWRSAKRLAHGSTDPETITWVGAREVVRALYEHQPPARVLELAIKAESVGLPKASAATVELLCGKAQALSLAGARAPAESALGDAREHFDSLPDLVTRDSGSIFDWPENRLRFTESFVYSHLGLKAQADDAQTQAVKLYPGTYPRGPTQIELQRALCLVISGDTHEGVRHATVTLQRLPAEHSIRPIVDLSHKVLSSVSTADRDHPAVTAYADYLAETSPSGSRP